jgi:RimJ/RimL family protein N-acetyltransferase
MMHPEVVLNLGTGVRFRLKRAMASTLARVSDVESRRAIDRLRRQWERCGYGEWAVEEKATGELIGKIGLTHHPDWPAGDAKVEIGWTLAPRAWGRGFATEGARVALAHAFGELMLPRVISIARTDNHRSIRVMERLGLREQGYAHWRGSQMVWYAVDRGDWLGAGAATAVGAAR